MANFYAIIPDVLKWEGGYVNHPADPGGATNRGITIGTFRQFYKLSGVSEPSLENLQALTEEQAVSIYHGAFWSLMRGDEIKDQDIAANLFDFFVNAGNFAVIEMQKCLVARGAHIKIDGAIGPVTIDAINSAPPELYEDFYQARIEYYKRLAHDYPKMAVFLTGWLRRAESFKKI